MKTGFSIILGLENATQGGPFSQEEASECERLAWCLDAVQLRRWDDAAKQPGLIVPGLDEYRTLLTNVIPG